MAKYPEVKLKKEKLNIQIVKMISEDTARKYKVIAVRVEGDILYVAMANPANLPVRDELKLLTGCTIKALSASEKDIIQAIGQYYKIEEKSRQTLIDMRLAKLKEVKKKEKIIIPLEEELRRVEDLPIVKLVNDIVNGGINAKASDIHLEPQDPEMIVRYRVDGVLHDIMTIPKYIELQVVSRVKILSNMDITERRKPQDGHIFLKKEDKEYDFRVSTVLTIGGEKIVMRIFDKSAMLIDLEQLGFTGEDETRFSELIKRPCGMILVVGPTGSGKTTTLYVALKQLNSKENNIITIENPVEYKLDRINQVQVDEGIKMTFSTGLRTILRQDPDIIMIGEIRDKETAEIAIQAALTGHLVFSTLHTNDASSAVTRLIDMGIEPFLISSTVAGCLAQRLCRTICSECKGAGCDICYGTGFKGRTGIFELMVMSEGVQDLILNKKPASEIKRFTIKEGMKTLEENGKQKVSGGISTEEEVKRVVY
ncbi:MAG: type II/IV secretion system protein [Candidatus Omnitrophica bacterium]|nr:type II/IV secretion system protein [Candidatus Omnitrophota bacterium]